MSPSGLLIAAERDATVGDDERPWKGCRRARKNSKKVLTSTIPAPGNSEKILTSDFAGEEKLEKGLDELISDDLKLEKDVNE